ncbi:hypothetical protein [Streptomyces sp. PAM3C]|nr:hypothetical protein [Streptomyces sp. PAM3C]MBU5946746.1 hypothetical protein [Streptomyces sp. PAM3C]
MDHVGVDARGLESAYRFGADCGIFASERVDDRHRAVVNLGCERGHTA